MTPAAGCGCNRSLLLFLVVDNGEPGTTDAHLDSPLLTPPTTCPVPGPFAFPHKRSNFVVHDAAP